MNINYKKLADSILVVIDRRRDDSGAYNDLFSLCRNWETDTCSMTYFRIRHWYRPTLIQKSLT